MRKRPVQTTDSFSYRLEYAMIQRKYRNCDICESSRLMGYPMGSSTISQYLSGKYSPKQDKIVLLAKILGVPELWLMGILPIEDIKGNSLKEYNNPQEAEILSNFRSLNKEGKKLVLQLIHTITNTREYIY